jgi:hypothetical protein
MRNFVRNNIFHSTRKLSVMKLFASLLLLIAIVSNTNAEQSTKYFDKDGPAREMVEELVRGKLASNGPAMLCDQAAYLACHGVYHAQCLNELALIGKECEAKAADKAVGLNADVLFKQYTDTYIACLVTKHIFSRIEKIETVGRCLKNMEFDKEVMTRSLLK